MAAAEAAKTQVACQTPWYWCDLEFLPPCSIVIPNVIPAVEAASHVGESKPVWRVAFFSRLEERKGLKLFVEAVGRMAEKAPLDQRYAFPHCKITSNRLDNCRVL